MRPRTAQLWQAHGLGSGSGLGGDGSNPAPSVPILDRQALSESVLGPLGSGLNSGNVTPTSQAGRERRVHRTVVPDVLRKDSNF